MVFLIMWNMCTRVAKWRNMGELRSLLTSYLCQRLQGCMMVFRRIPTYTFEAAGRTWLQSHNSWSTMGPHIVKSIQGKTVFTILGTRLNVSTNKKIRCAWLMKMHLIIEFRNLKIFKKITRFQTFKKIKLTTNRSWRDLTTFVLNCTIKNVVNYIRRT